MEMKNNMVSVSIIIPIYNCGSSLRRCLDSIISQKYADFEVLLVNDGSTDDSEQICLEYVDKDERFRYFPKKNGGVSSARNLGLCHAQGQYITFIDSDDYIGRDYLSKLIKYIHPDSLVQCGLKRVSGTVVTDIKCVQHALATSSMTDILDHIRGFACSKLYDRALIEQHSIRFDEKMTLAEDLCFVLDYIYYAQCVTFIPENEYYYIENQQSASFKLHKPEALFRAWNAKWLLIERLNSREQIEETTLRNWKNYIARDIFTWTISLAIYDCKTPFDSSLPKELANRYGQYSDVLQGTHTGSKVKDLILSMMLKRQFRAASMLIYFVSFKVRRNYRIVR